MTMSQSSTSGHSVIASTTNMQDYHPLFPVDPSRIVAGFTSFTSLPNHAGLTMIKTVPLNDMALGVHKISGRTTHSLVVPPAYNTPDDTELTYNACKEPAWQAVYPKGSINPAHDDAPAGGFGFYLGGPPDFAARLREGRVATRTEVIMSYKVMFEEGWKWGRGGKLPGIYGGAGNEAYGCTGGRRKMELCDCFNLRLMWRSDGLGELYAYLPLIPPNTSRLLAVPPRSVQNPDYGFSVGRGAWTFATGRWTSIAQRVKMNDVGSANGEIEVFIDGRSVIQVTGLILRTQEHPASHVQGLHFQTFFGGHTAEWASPQDQKAWFRHISGAILGPVEAAHRAGSHDEF